MTNDLGLIPFARMARALELWWRKRQAKRLLMRIRARSDGLDCGQRLADIIRPDIAKDERAFNVTMNRIRELDPKAPRHD